MYTLGYIINGKQYIVYSGKDFPPTGMHDMLWNTVSILRALYPNDGISSFQLSDGQPYSC